MKKVLLFISVLISLQVFSQEGTKQLMPIKTYPLYLEFNVFSGGNFGNYSATEKERIYIYLNEGETMHFGMKMNTINYGGNVSQNPSNLYFRVKNPSGTKIFPTSSAEQQMPTSGTGYIATWEQAVKGPNGVILNGATITGGYTPFVYVAETSGNYYIEFDKKLEYYRFALEFFDVTVTDASNKVITNPGEPNRSAGRLWSYGWQLCNTSFDDYPVNAHFYVVTDDRFINKVNFEMTPFSFVFLANKFGITPGNEQPNYIKRTQSMEGDEISGENIAEYPIFLNDPDRFVWPNILLTPPKVQVWAEEELFMDYNYNRDSQYLNLGLSSVVLEKNKEIDCDFDDVTFFKIESSLDGYAVVLIDIDGDGEYSTNNSDRVIYREVKKGLNYILWDFKTDAGALVANDTFNTSATFLGRGPSHFPLYDVEQLSGISTSAIRPFNKLNTTIYWDDTQITNWGDNTSTNLMDSTRQKQLRVESTIPRLWSWADDPNDDNNGNLNTMNTWFNALDLGYRSFNVIVKQSLTKCVDGSAPFVGDVYFQGPLNTDIVFDVTDLDYKFFHTGSLPLSSIRIETLPKEGSLFYNSNPATVGLVVPRGSIGLLSYTPPTGFHGKDSLVWKASDGFNWSNNQENIYLIINTDPTITEIVDQKLCTNTPTAPIGFTIGDLDGDELTVTGFSANPEFVPHTGIQIDGTGINRTVTVTPVANKSGKAIIYIMVDDGLSQVIEEFAVTVSPSLEFDGKTLVCVGDDLNLIAEEAAAGTIYDWKYNSLSVSPDRNLIKTPPVEGSWSLTVTNTVEGNTCSSTRNFNVSTAPNTSFTGDIDVCTGETIYLNADENTAEYSWKKNGVELTTSKDYTKLNASSADADSYSLWVRKYGCENTRNFSITVKNPASTANTVTGNTVDPGQNGTITVANATNLITYNVYNENDLTTVISSAIGSGSNLSISIPHAELSIGNNIFKVGAFNGNCEVMLADTGKIVVRQPGFTVSAISRNTTEAGLNATFTIKLNTKPYKEVSINLSSDDLSEGTVSPASVTYDSLNYSSNQTVTVTGIDDDIIDGNITYHIITSSAVSLDTNYSDLNPNDVVVINNDDDIAGVTVSTISGNTTEAGGTAQFTVVLDCQPDAGVSINLSSDNINEGLITSVSRGTTTPASNTATITFDDSNWNIPITITVTGQNDDIDDDDQPYSIITSLTSSPGDSHFNGLLVDDVEITNSDDDNAGITVTPTIGLETTENVGTDEFTIVLTSEPTSDVSIALSSSNSAEGTVFPENITFNASNWDIPQTVTVTGVDDDIDDGDIPYTVTTAAATSLDGKYSGLNPSNVSVTNIDNDNAAIIVSPLSGLLTNEGGGQATFTVRLATQPIANITISVIPSDITEGTVNSSLLTFTNANWNDDQTVTITGVNDYVVDGTVNYTITLSVTGGDTPYANLDDIVVSASNSDNDVAGITVSPTTINTSETGTTATFSLVLLSEPKNDVVVNFSGVDNTEGSINKTSVTFTAANWSVLQEVTVTGLDDAIADGPVGYTITTIATSDDSDYNNIDVNDISVTNADNDVAGITVLPTSGQTTEAGGYLDYTIVLNTQPTANVTINISSSDTGEGTVDLSSLTFTSVNWATPQTIRITGVNDEIDDGNISYTIVNSIAVSTDGTYGGMSVEDVSMSNIDNDIAGITVSTISGNTTEGGGTATYTVVLNTEPTADVVVSFATGDATEGAVSPASHTFTTANWSTPRTVIVTGQNDNIDDGNQTYQINVSVSSSDGNYGSSLNTSVSVINEDNDIAGITVSSISGNTTEGGGAATFTVKLNTEPIANVIISFSSSNSLEGIPSPLSYTFTSANWNTEQTVTVTGQNDDIDDGDKIYQVNVSVGGSDGNYTSAFNTQVSVTNVDDDLAGVTINPLTGLETTEAVGGTSTFTVVLDTRPTATVRVNFSSSDNTEGTVSPAYVDFTTSNWNTPRTITITGVDDAVDDGDINYSIITSISTGSDGVYNIINPADISVKNIDNDLAGVTVNPIIGLETTEAGGTAIFTVVLNTQPVANVTISYNSSNETEGKVSLLSHTFSPANWSTPQSVTITGQNDFVDDNDKPYSIVTTMQSGADVVYNAINPADVSVTNIDDDAVGITVNPNAGLYTTESGGTETFDVRLNSQPAADVSITLYSNNENEGKIDKNSLTFTSVNWNTNQTVTVTGQNDNIDDDDQAYSIITNPAVSSDILYNSINPANVSITNQDDDQAGITVSPQNITINEAGASQSFTIVLQSEPTANVTINLSSNNINKGTIDKANVVFTSANWSVPQTVTISPVDNDIDDGNINFNIVTAAALSDDTDYKNRNAADVTVTSNDDDESEIIVSSISGNTSEDLTTATFTIVLNSEPTNDVSIDISSDDTGEGTVSHANVTFTSLTWDTPVEITVTGVDDGIADGNQTYHIIMAAAVSDDGNYDNMNAADITLVNSDNDSPGVTVFPYTGHFTTEADGTSSFKVRLNSEPTNDVTLSLSSSNTDEGTIDKASLLFTTANYNIDQTVIITGVDDVLNDGDKPFTINFTNIESIDEGYDTITIIQNVSAVNRDDIGPRAADDAITTDEDSNININILSNDKGLDDGNISVAISTQPLHGTVVVESNKTITYTPNGLFNGDDTFIYRVCDGENDCDEATVTITVTWMDDFPVALIDGRGTSINTPRYVDILFNDYGMEDGGIIISIDQHPDVNEGAVTIVGDSIQFTPALDYLGTSDFIYKITDADGDFDTAIVIITIRDINHVPVAVDDNAETTINTDVTISVLANDSGLEDGFGSLQIHTNPTHGTVLVNANRSVTYTPTAGYTGNDSFQYLVEDVDGDYDLATVTINVLPLGDAHPVAANDYRATDYETPVYLDVLINDSGLADIPLTLSITTDPINGVAVITADSILYTPNTGFSGIETLRYQIRDNDGDNSNTATVTINVLPENVTNYKPVALNDTVETNENTPAIVNVLNNDTIIDVFGKLQIYSVPEFGTAVVNANRTITYIPSNSFIGSDSFEYWVEDVHGDYDIATVFVDVIVKPNAIPVANNDERGTNYETARYIDVLANDIGLEDGGIILNVITAPTQGTAVVTADSILYTPAAGFSGTSIFEYSVTDKDGDGDTASVTITVKPEGINNYIPVALNDTVLTYVNQPINIYVLNNDTLLDAFGDLKIHSNPQFGLVTVNASRSITYTPFNMIVGNDSFEYWVQDEEGDYDIATVFVEITEKPNSIPVANDDERGTNFEEQRYIDVLFNDTGLDDGGIVIKVVTPPVNGTALVVGDSILYTPGNGFSGYSDFFYSVTDIDGEGDTARVTVNVYPEGFYNHIPVAVDDSVSTYMNIPVDIIVLNNDTIKDGFGALSVYTAPSSGTIILNANRTFTYTPNPMFIGRDEFKYLVQDLDGDHDHDIATVFIEVIERPNAIPIANDDERGTKYQTPRYVDVLYNDKGLEDGGIILKIITAPVNGTAVITTDSILYTPEALFSGTSTFEYSVTDKDGDGDTARVTITVLPEGVDNHIPVAINDSVETIMNIPININVLANDTILDTFGELTVWVNPKYGTAVVNANRTITYTPSNLFVGSDSLKYYVRDEHGDYDVATVFVDVILKPNAVPVANNDERGTNYQTPRYVDVLYNDKGLEDGGIILKIITAPVNGTAVITTDSILYTPEALFSGTSTFEYSVTDKDGDGDTARVTITVLPEGVDNHIPVAINDSVETIINTSIDINVLANDTILDAFGEGSVWVNPKYGTAVANPNRTITYTPSNLFIGGDSFEYWVEDVHGDYDIAIVSVTVIETPNAIPVANDDARGTNYETPKYVDVLVNDSGLEDGDIILKIITAPTQGTAVVTADSILFTPAAGFSGQSTFYYSVTDKDGDGDTAQVTLTVLPEGVSNHIPVAVNDTVETVINTAIVINVLANDSINDGFGDLILFANPEYGTAVVNANRTITYTPSNLFIGNDSFEYWVEDIHGDYDIAAVSITVTEVPDALPVANDDVRGTEYQTMVSIDVLTNDKGIEDQPVILTIESDPAQGLVIVNADKIEFTPANGFAGLMTFQYRVTDNDGDWDVATVTITVKPDGQPNYIPIAVNDSVETLENTSINISVLANDSGLDDGFGKIIIFKYPDFGSLTINLNRTITYQPSPWFVGTEEFVYWLEDLDGDYDTARVVVHVVKPGNHLPVANDDARGTDYNTPVTIDVLVNDKGLEDGGIVVTIESNPITGVASVNPDNTVTFIPENGFFGLETFQYKVTDKEGDYDIANVTITVKGEGIENHIPFAVNDTIETIENTPVNINILANDSNFDDGFGKIIIFTEPMFGVVEVNDNRTITYTPANAFLGADSLVYWVEDVDGDYDMASVIIQVLVKPDYQPVANDDARGTNYQTLVSVDVLTNDTDLEDTPITLSVAENPTTGAAVVNGDKIDYTPATGFSGVVSFKYRVTDNDGDNSTATVTITVLPEGVSNHIPVAVNDAVETIINTSVTVDVLLNDTGLEDGFGNLTIFSSPNHGTVVVNGDRSITYTPSNLFKGTDSLEYWIEDIHGDYDIGKVVITVTDRPDYQPVANDDALGTNYQTLVSVDVLTNDTDLEDTPITLSVAENPTTGTSVVNGDKIDYTPATGFSGVVSFKYRVTDNDGDDSTATVTITVLPEGVSNYIPVAVDDAVETIINTAVTVDVLSNDTGLEDGFGSLTIFSLPNHGTAVVNGDRSITYTPSNLFKGTDSLEYWIADIHGDYDIGKLVITVTDRPNYHPVANDDARGASFNTPVDVDVLVNDTGLEDEPIRVSIETIPDVSTGNVIVNGDNTIKFTPATDYIGFAHFRYRVEDNDGDWDTAMVVINIKSGINYVPEAINDVVTTLENTPVDINVLSNDRGLDDGIGELIIFKNPEHGSIIVNADYTIKYTPSSWYIGTDVFEYMITDTDGDYDIATVTVTTNPIINNVPVANADSRGTSISTPVIIDVLFNDTGLGDGGIVVSINTNPTNGSVLVNADNTVTYTPNSGYLGNDQFEYQVCDVNNDCDIALVTINVKENNHIPLATDDKYYVNMNSSKALNILENDFGLEDGGITIEILTQVMVGQITINDDNTLTYMPLTGFVGNDSFVYKVTDSDGDYDLATVTIVVMDGVLPDVSILYSGNTKENGASVSVSFALTVAPVNDVSIDLLSHDETEGALSDTRVTFTSANWSTPQVITVIGVDDHIIDGNIDYVINTGNMVSSDPVYNLLNVNNISLINEDDDVAEVILSIDDYTTSEDGKETEFAFVLSSEPESDVTINLSSSNESEGTLDAVSVMFTPANWNASQTIKVTGVDDNLKDGDINYYILCALNTFDSNYMSLSISDLQLTNIDNDGQYGLIIPEAFSPDNDGYNDKFEILGLEKYDRVSIKIYNRWGNVIYTENNYKNNWDGKANSTMAVGQELPTGTYFYILTIKDKDKEISGYIFLKR